MSKILNCKDFLSFKRTIYLFNDHVDLITNESFSQVQPNKTIIFTHAFNCRKKNIQMRCFKILIPIITFIGSVIVVPCSIFLISKKNKWIERKKENQIASVLFDFLNVLLCHFRKKLNFYNRKIVFLWNTSLFCEKKNKKTKTKSVCFSIKLLFIKFYVIIFYKF